MINVHEWKRFPLCSKLYFLLLVREKFRYECRKMYSILWQEWRKVDCDRPVDYKAFFFFLDSEQLEEKIAYCENVTEI